MKINKQVVYLQAAVGFPSGPWNLERIHTKFPNKKNISLSYRANRKCLMQELKCFLFGLGYFM